MNLERSLIFFTSRRKRSDTLLVGLGMLFLCNVQPLGAQSAGKPKLIRDTDIAEGKESKEEYAAPKERNPMLAEANIEIGNFYFKRKNYTAAIQRYLDAIEYQSDSIKAHEALARAYEKDDQITKAIDTYREFIINNPGSPQIPEFRTKLNKLEKKLQ